MSILLFLQFSLVLVLCAPLKPHILFILQDDLGYYDVAFNGNSALAMETASITSLAKEGIILKRHYVHWHCSPTRRTLMSGRFPIHHGEQLSGIATDDLDLRWSWISDKLKQAGYENHWFGKGHTGYVSMNHLPTKHGFDSFYGFLSGSQKYTDADRWDDEHPNHDQTYSSTLYGEKALSVINAHDTKKPLFIYLAYQAVHTPYNAVPHWNTSTVCQGHQSVYCGMLWDADVYVNKIITLLKSKGMYDNTLIIYSADNGGVGDGINYPLRGEKHSNWDGAMRTAAFVSGGAIPSKLRGTTNGINFHIADWYPTLCSLAGVSGTDDPPVAPLPVDLSNPDKDIYGNSSFPPVDGVNIWPMLMDPSSHNQSSAHTYLPLTKEVLLAGPYKLLVAQPHFKSQNNGWKYPNGTWTKSVEMPCTHQDGPLDNILPGVPGQLPCLFHITDDEREMHDLAPKKPNIVSELWRALNMSVLTSFLHGASGPVGNPGQISRCSPPEMIGPCNKTCAQQYFSKWDGNFSKCSMDVLVGVAYRGGSSAYKKLNTSDANACCVACDADGPDKCTHWTFNPSDPPVCHLKGGSIPSTTKSAGCTSGSTAGPPTPSPQNCQKAGTHFPICAVPGCN